MLYLFIYVERQLCSCCVYICVFSVVANGLEKQKKRLEENETEPNNNNNKKYNVTINISLRDALNEGCGSQDIIYCCHFTF